LPEGKKEVPAVKKGTLDMGGEKTEAKNLEEGITNTRGISPAGESKKPHLRGRRGPRKRRKSLHRGSPLRKPKKRGEVKQGIPSGGDTSRGDRSGEKNLVKRGTEKHQTQKQP